MEINKEQTTNSDSDASATSTKKSSGGFFRYLASIFGYVNNENASSINDEVEREKMQKGQNLTQQENHHSASFKSNWKVHTQSANKTYPGTVKPVNVSNPSSQQRFR
jgi:hypothetical protein